MDANVSKNETWIRMLEMWRYYEAIPNAVGVPQSFEGFVQGFVISDPSYSWQLYNLPWVRMPGANSESNGMYQIINPEDPNFSIGYVLLNTFGDDSNLRHILREVLDEGYNPGIITEEILDEWQETLISLTEELSNRLGFTDCVSYSQTNRVLYAYVSENSNVLPPPPTLTDYYTYLLDSSHGYQNFKSEFPIVELSGDPGEDQYIILKYLSGQIFSNMREIYMQTVLYPEYVDSYVNIEACRETSQADVYNKRAFNRAHPKRVPNAPGNLR
ncbi:MAG TPA: hypothetical protein PLL26_04750 [Candidatus Dojkabacteria bacterium]|nr:hypothetical protein [Candidatus Dojkabacteria bacterium]